MRFIELAGEKVPVLFSAKGGVLTYQLSTTVPEVELPVRLRIELLTRRRPWRPAVFASGVAECLRHRYSDGSLCMWWEAHPNARRWVPSDGVPALVHYAQVHLFQEACCRASLPWPGEEAPGEHPRRRRCTTCEGIGP